MNQKTKRLINLAQPRLSRKDIRRVVEACLENDARSAAVYISPTVVVRASRRFPAGKNLTRQEIVLVIGKPNYKHRQFIKACKKAGEPFPVKKIQLTWFK